MFFAIVLPSLTEVIPTYIGRLCGNIIGIRLILRSSLRQFDILRYMQRGSISSEIVHANILQEQYLSSETVDPFPEGNRPTS